MPSELARRLREGSADPLDDDGCCEVPEGHEAAAWIVATLAVNHVGADAPEPLLEGAAMLRGWLQEGSPSDETTSFARAEELVRVIVRGPFGDLYCVPACCWTGVTARAYLVASALLRRLRLAGRKVNVAKRFYDAQNLVEVLGLIDGVSPAVIREGLREPLARHCEALVGEDAPPASSR